MNRRPSRREFLVSSAAAAAASSVAFTPRAQAAAESYAATYPDMLLNCVASKLNAFAASWKQVRDKIRTPEDVEKRNRYVREKLKDMIHGYPERTPLGVEVKAVHQRDGYRVENIMFQSLPDFWVTANLYVPAT